MTTKQKIGVALMIGFVLSCAAFLGITCSIQDALLFLGVIVFAALFANLITWLFHS